MRAHSKFNQNVTKLFCRHQHTRFKAGGAVGVEGQQARQDIQGRLPGSPPSACLLYTSDAADDTCVV